ASLALPGLSLAILPPAQPAGGTAKFDLTLTVTEEGNSLAASLEYRTDLFDRTTVIQLVARLERLLTAALADPPPHLSALPLLSDAERHQLAVSCNDTAVPSAGPQTLGELFAAQARRTPQAVAVESSEGSSLTYGELLARAAVLAWQLRGLGVVPET